MSFGAVTKSSIVFPIISSKSSPVFVSSRLSFGSSTSSWVVGLSVESGEFLTCWIGVDNSGVSLSFSCESAASSVVVSVLTSVKISPKAFSIAFFTSFWLSDSED
ncbi:Uncharacterised protein [Chlamydia trachomatis]|nr:Uncharacterised protein [Chlamydia trachomatis]